MDETLSQFLQVFRQIAEIYTPNGRIDIDQLFNKSLGTLNDPKPIYFRQNNPFFKILNNFFFNFLMIYRSSLRFNQFVAFLRSILSFRSPQRIIAPMFYCFKKVKYGSITPQMLILGTSVLRAFQLHTFLRFVGG